jgi:hypothetical protein
VKGSVRDINVELVGDEIVVTKPATDFMVPYRTMPDRQRFLIAHRLRSASFLAAAPSIKLWRL